MGTPTSGHWRLTLAGWFTICTYTNLERGGNPIIELYDSDNLEAEPLRIDSSPMEILPGIRWIDDDVFLFNARQKVRDIIEGFNRGVYEYQNVKYDGSKKKPIGRIRQDYFRVEEVLPDKKNKIIISIQEGVPDGLTGRIINNQTSVVLGI